MKFDIVDKPSNIRRYGATIDEKALAEAVLGHEGQAVRIKFDSAEKAGNGRSSIYFRLRPYLNGRKISTFVRDKFLYVWVR